jgi:hypothetical protein
MKMLPIQSTIEKAATEGLRDGGRQLMREAKNLAPEDDSDLKDSFRVTVADGEVTVAATAPHAWLQHERLDWNHPNGGQAKFLETAADSVSVEEAVAARVRAALGG